MDPVRSDVTIRPATVVDLHRLADLDVEVFGHISYPLFVFRQFLDLVGPSLIVASRDDVLLGYALVSPTHEDRVGYFVSLGVREAARGSGLGRALARAGMQRLAELGIASVHLTVTPDNKPAIALYRSLGFTDSGLERDYLGPGEDRLVMELGLTHA